MSGLFDLASPHDLLRKLGRELDRMRESPDDSDHAFNFFVTAEHILDWLYPGFEGRFKRKERRDAALILKVTWDLANGAKHFKLSKIHKSVRNTKHSGGFWAKGFWAENFWAKGFWAEPKLIVELSPEEAAELGKGPSAMNLAEQVYAYWHDHIDAA